MEKMAAGAGRRSGARAPARCQRQAPPPNKYTHNARTHVRSHASTCARRQARRTLRNTTAAHTHLRRANLALQLGARHERRHAVDDYEVDAARSAQLVHDLQRLLARAGLAEAQPPDVDAKLLGRACTCMDAHAGTCTSTCMRAGAMVGTGEGGVRMRAEGRAHFQGAWDPCTGAPSPACSCSCVACNCCAGTPHAGAPRPGRHARNPPPARTQATHPPTTRPPTQSPVRICRQTHAPRRCRPPPLPPFAPRPRRAWPGWSSRSPLGRRSTRGGGTRATIQGRGTGARVVGDGGVQACVPHAPARSGATGTTAACLNTASSAPGPCMN